MLIPKTIFNLIICAILCPKTQAQTTTYNFHRLTTADGLSDGTIRAVTQDKYGYIWIATITSLNRYDGYSVETYNYSETDTSIFPYGNIISLFSDINGNLWMGMNNGLYKFNFINNHFEFQKNSKNTAINDFVQLNTDTLLIATNKGLAVYAERKKEFRFYEDRTKNASSNLSQRRVNDLCIYKNNLVLLGTDTGLVVIDIRQNSVQYIANIPQGNYGIKRITGDDFGNVWMTVGFNFSLLVRTNIAFSKFKVYDNFTHSSEGINDNTITDILVDSQNRLWLGTVSNGVARYDATDDNFRSFSYDAQQPMCIVANNLSVLFQDRNGFIWAGTEGYGISYFDPDHNLFRVIMPSVNSLPELPGKWCRAFAEDGDNHMWLGIGGGLVCYDIKTRRVNLWQNSKTAPGELHNNSIRSILYDSDHHVWIGTANGVDRFSTTTLRKENFKDENSLPLSFYWAILQDHNKTIWFGTRNGLFFLDPSNKEIHSIAAHPVLAKYNGWGVRSLFEDSRGRLWIGLNGGGALMYDASSQKCSYWKRTDSTKNTIQDNFITSFAEDKEGIIWIGSFGGLAAYDPYKNNFTHYSTDNGFIFSRAACLMIDKKDRLWIGSSKGLAMLDSSRKNFHYFDREDGLPINEFNDQIAYRMNDGRFVFPSMNGFVLFDPLQYSGGSKPIDLYVSSLKVSNKDYRTSVNTEDMTTIDLKPSQNFFSLQLSALNYSNPRQTWYAYKLFPLEKDWIYTRERNINYTNVPGGTYQFYFKATTDQNNWNVPEKVINIHVSTIFYKTTWFLLLWISIILFAVYSLYRYRLMQQNKIFILQTKAQELEKEKAVAMYENLQQHLNPHFLFNSLTSLGSLIKRDQKIAGDFLEGLSKIYRYILKSRDAETVTLLEEIKFAHTFIKLQQTRFNSGLQVSIAVAAEYYPCRIVPVTLQNLIENAIKHNVIDEESPLLIEVSAKKDYLIVLNNLQKKDFVETSNKQGLLNMKLLYHYLTDKPVIITEAAKFFTVKIPLL